MTFWLEESRESSIIFGGKDKSLLNQEKKYTDEVDMKLKSTDLPPLYRCPDPCAPAFGVWSTSTWAGAWSIWRWMTDLTEAMVEASSEQLSGAQISLRRYGRKIAARMA